MSGMNPIAAFQASLATANVAAARHAAAPAKDGDGDHGVEPSAAAPAAAPSPGQPGAIINTQA